MKFLSAWSKRSLVCSGVECVSHFAVAVCLLHGIQCAGQSKHVGSIDAGLLQNTMVPGARYGSWANEPATGSTNVKLVVVVEQFRGVTKPPPSLSADFSRAARKALQAIRACVEVMGLEDGQIVLPHRAQALVEKADKAAGSKEEKAIVVVLKNLFLSRLNTNMSRVVIVQNGFSPESSEKYRKEADADPSIASSESTQRACGISLDEILRSRKYKPLPKECNSLQF